MKIKPIQYYLTKQNKGTLTLTEKLALSYICMQSFDKMTQEEMNNPANQERYTKAYQSFYSTFYRTMQTLSKSMNGRSALSRLIGAKELENLDYDHSIKEIKNKFSVEKIISIFDKLEHGKEDMLGFSNPMYQIDKETENEIINQFPEIAPKESIQKNEKEDNRLIGEDEFVDNIDDSEELDSEELDFGTNENYLPEKRVNKFKSDLEAKVDNKSIGQDCNARQALNDLRIYRKHYSQYSLFSRITATLFGVPKVVADDRKWINMIKNSCKASNIPEDFIAATDPDVSQEQFEEKVNNTTELDKTTITSYSMELFHSLAEAAKPSDKQVNNVDKKMKEDDELDNDELDNDGPIDEETYEELYHLVTGYDFNKSAEENKIIAKEKVKNLGNDTNMLGPIIEESPEVKEEHKNLEKEPEKKI